MRKLFVVFCFGFLFIGAGCAQQKIVEEMGFIHSVGYDLNESEKAKEEGELIITVNFPQIAETSQNPRVNLTTKAHTSKDGRTQLARRTERVLVSGQLRTALFNDRLAERGFIDTIDTLVRDHIIGLNVKVIVVKGSTKELLMTDYPDHQRTSRYVYELIDKEAQTNVTVDTSLYHFFRDYYDDGIDPVAPLLKQGQKELIIDGIGLFSGDRLVMQVNPNDSRVFMMLHGDYLGGTITRKIALEDETKEGEYLYITFDTLESTRQVKVKSPTDIQIDLDVKGGIDEYTGHLDLSNDNVQKEIEKKLGDYIKELSEKIIKEMQQKKTDSLGIGQHVRNSSSYQNWKQMKWKEEIYPDVKFTVNVKVKLKGFGAVK